MSSLPEGSTHPTWLSAMAVEPPGRAAAAVPQLCARLCSPALLAAFVDLWVLPCLSLPVRNSLGAAAARHVSLR